MSVVAPSAEGARATSGEVLISADSHVMEPHDLWTKALSGRFGDKAPAFTPLKVGESFQHHPGGHDPHERIKEMGQDGVSGEVLYPTLALSLFGLDDAELQEACFRVYNDWLIDYCSVDLERLVGIAAIPVYDVQKGVAELERCAKAGLKGGIIWEAPLPSLPLHSDHYNPLWEASSKLGMPISLHILTGHNYSKGGLRPNGVEHYRGSVNLKTVDAINDVFDLVFYGVLDRYPDLRIVMVEHEASWLPYFEQQWDYYWRRFKAKNPPPIQKAPSEYVREQVYVTFFNDSLGGKLLSFWGHDNCMWSNDFPHENSTWPNSRQVIQRDLGHLPDDVRRKLIRDNVVRLYNMKVPSPV